MSYVIVPIKNKTAEEILALRDVFRQKKLDYIEIDVSEIDARDTKKIIKELGEFAPIIGTARAIKTEEKLVEKMQNVLTGGGAFFDVDLTQASEKVIKSISLGELILSFHDYDGVPEKTKLIEIVSVIGRFNPHIGKLAVTPRNQNELGQFLDFCEKIKGRKIITTMGDFGLAGRVEIEKRGLSWGDFFALSEEMKTAVGQRIVANRRE